MKRRIDSFIIWGHGIQYIREIMCTLRDNFEIITIRRIAIDDMPGFVGDIYDCDTYPASHLKAKNAYLMKVPKEIIFVLVVNNDVDEHPSGSGAFRGVQCSHVVAVKKKIRERFNPRPHDHVIHGTDYERQTGHILKVLGLQPLEYWTKNKPYHLPAAGRKKTKVHIDDLRANILGAGLVKIEDTPHYKYLTGDKKAYEDYFFRHMGRGLNEDHFPEAFDRLIDMDHEPIIVKGSIILDGVHRAAIAKYNGKKEIEAWT